MCVRKPIGSVVDDSFSETTGHRVQCKMLQIRDLRTFSETTLPLLGQQWAEQKVRQSLISAVSSVADPD